MMRAQPEGAGASIQKVRQNRTTDDDAHLTLMARGPRGFTLSAVHSVQRKVGQNNRG